jgi:UPF0755 protein
VCAILLFLAGGGLGAGYWALEEWSRRPFGAAGACKLTIKPKTSSREIGRLLWREGLISNDSIFLMWLKIHQRNHRLQAGDFQLQTPISPQGLIDTLSHGRFGRTLTIPEGWTARQIARRLAAEGWIKQEQEWLELVARPLGPEILGAALVGGAEGFSFPETYSFDVGVKPEEILRRMLAKFRHEWDRADPSRRDPRSARLTILEVVTLASMIEREARTPQEMPGIASVYLNRLKIGMKMQCCATVRYALGEVWDRPLTYNDLTVDSAYNTYLHHGLPPAPIANPGRAAIAGVLRPARTDDLFYVYAGNHHHIFSRTHAEHQKAIREIRKTKNAQEVIPGQE